MRTISDYRAEIERRIGQFRRYLEPMDRRVHEEALGSCFLIFQNHHPDDAPGREMREEREPGLGAVAEALGESGAAPPWANLGRPTCQRRSGEKRISPPLRPVSLPERVFEPLTSAVQS